jgi:hypothetical protein
MPSKTVAGVALALAVSGGCNKAKPELPATVVLMETPPPEARLFIPVELPEPAPPPPETPVPAATTPEPARPNPVTPAKPAERPAAAPPAEAPPPPVLRTTTDTTATERRIVQLIEAAEQNLNRVNYRNLNADARTQYDAARTFIRLAGTAIKVKNYTYADQCATNASRLAQLLIKG